MKSEIVKSGTVYFFAGVSPVNGNGSRYFEGTCTLLEDTKPIEIRNHIAALMKQKDPDLTEFSLIALNRI